MTSVQMRTVGLYLRLTRKPASSTVELARAQLLEPKGSARPPRKMQEAHVVTSRQVGDFECYTVGPRGRIARRAVIYLHGGAYYGEIAPQHWTFISRLADAGVRVEVPLYGLAPQHTYRQAYPFLTAGYERLLAEVDASSITFAGDSAGGGLALGLAQTLAEAGLPQPGKLLLISPWLDLTLSDPQMPAAEARDPWLNSVGLIEAGRSWAGGDDPTSPRLSPLNGPLTGLAPMHAFVGTHDVLHPDSLALRDRAREQGVELELTVCEGAIHVYPLLPVPEGRSARAAIVRELAS